MTYTSHTFETEEEWLAYRKTVLTGTDSGALLGVNRYKSPLRVWRSKMGLESFDGLRPAAQAGQLLEDWVAQTWAASKGITLDPLPKYHMFTSVERPWQSGTPDFLWNNAQNCLEIKCVFSPRQMHRWGTPGTDQIPDEYLCQVHWYLDILGIKEGTVVTFMGGEIKEYKVPFKQKLANVARKKAKDFWDGHVITGWEPPIDGSEDWRKHLQAKWEPKAGSVIEGADEEQSQLDALRIAEQKAAEAEKEVEACKQTIKSTMGEAELLRFPSGERATWKTDSRGTRRFRVWGG